MKTERLYRNKDWLKDKYCEEELSTCQIGKLLNCSSVQIQYWLRKFNISIRSISEAKHLGFRKKIGNDNYCDRNWLRKKYSEEQLSTYQISRLTKTSQGTIRNWFKKYNIPCRSIGEGIHLNQGNHCNLSDEARQWIDGELMGDGCLRSQSKYSASFFYGSKYPEYIQYVSDTLQSFGIKQSGKIHKRYYKKGNCYTYNYSSLNYIELLPIYKRWYLDGKKRIPRDLKLTPLTLRQEYIGDGHLAHRKHRSPYIELATCGFLAADIKWLVLQLNKLGFKAKRWANHNSIGISTYSTRQFLDYIGECPVSCYQYKWGYDKTRYK